MPTLDDRIRALVARLLELTEQGDMKWTPESAARFQANAPSGLTVMIESLGDGGGYPYKFSILGEANQPIEVVESYGPDEEVGPWDLILRSLYIEARADALDIAGTVDRLLREFGVDPASVQTATPDDDIPF